MDDLDRDGSAGRQLTGRLLDGPEVDGGHTTLAEFTADGIGTEPTSLHGSQSTRSRAGRQILPDQSMASPSASLRIISANGKS
jgi:hypothetical protein